MIKKRGSITFALLLLVCLAFFSFQTTNVSATFYSSECDYRNMPIYADNTLCPNLLLPIGRYICLIPEGERAITSCGINNLDDPDWPDSTLSYCCNFNNSCVSDSDCVIGACVEATGYCTGTYNSRIKIGVDGSEFHWEIGDGGHSEMYANPVSEYSPTLFAFFENYTLGSCSKCDQAGNIGYQVEDAGIWKKYMCTRGDICIRPFWKEVVGFNEPAFYQADCGIFKTYESCIEYDSCTWNQESLGFCEDEETLWCTTPTSWNIPDNRMKANSVVCSNDGTKLYKSSSRCFLTIEICPEGSVCSNDECVSPDEPPEQQTCADVMTWIENPQAGDKSCDLNDPEGKRLVTCNADGTVTEETCSERCIEGEDNRNAACSEELVGECGSCNQDPDCQYGLSCETGLDGITKLCVPTGYCATGVAVDGVCYSNTTGCSGRTQYTCSVSMGDWINPQMSSDECGDRFEAYWSTDGRFSVSMLQPGETVYRYVVDNDNLFTGLIDILGDPSDDTGIQMTDGSKIFSYYGALSDVSPGDYSFYASIYDLRLATKTATITVPEPFCGNGTIESGEDCDNGTSNGVECTPEVGDLSCTYCTNDCKINTFMIPDKCGNGTIESGEECDNGTSNGVNPDLSDTQYYNQFQDYCTTLCEIETAYGPNCSDGIQNGNEFCTDCGDERCPEAKLNCPEGCEVGTENVCSDYETEKTCEAYDQKVANNSVSQIPGESYAECVWEEDVCKGNLYYISSDGEEVGNCVSTASSPTECVNGYQTYSWDSTMKWNDDLICKGDKTDCIPDSNGVYHYDPDEYWKTCKGGTKTIPCPAQVELSVFTLKNLIAAILLLIIIYLIIANIKKENKNKLKKEETKKKLEKIKETPTKKSNSKKKKTSKKK